MLSIENLTAAEISELYNKGKLFIKKFGANCLRDFIDPNIYDMEVL